MKFLIHNQLWNMVWCEPDRRANIQCDYYIDTTSWKAWVRWTWTTNNFNHGQKFLWLLKQSPFPQIWCLHNSFTSFIYLAAMKSFLVQSLPKFLKKPNHWRGQPYTNYSLFEVQTTLPAWIVPASSRNWDNLWQPALSEHWYLTLLHRSINISRIYMNFFSSCTGISWNLFLRVPIAHDAFFIFKVMRKH